MLICISKHQTILFAECSQRDTGEQAIRGRPCGQADDEVGTTIRYTRQVQAVQELAKEFIVFSDLLQEMSKRNPHVPLEVIEVFLNQLLENENSSSSFFNLEDNTLQSVLVLKSTWRQLSDLCRDSSIL